MCARVDEISTIAPRAARNASSAYLASRKAAVRLVAITLFQSLSLVSRRLVKRLTPAFDTRASRRPCALSVASTSVAMSASSLTSATVPVVPISAATAAVAAPSLSATTACPPSRASQRAVAAPMPWPAPVTMTTRCLSLRLMRCSSRWRLGFFSDALPRQAAGGVTPAQQSTRFELVAHPLQHFEGGGDLAFRQVGQAFFTQGVDDAADFFQHRLRLATQHAHLAAAVGLRHATDTAAWSTWPRAGPAASGAR